MLFIPYLISFILLWGKLRKNFGQFYAIAFCYTIIFSLIIINVVISQILTGHIQHTFVALLTLSMSGFLVFKMRHDSDKSDGKSPYTAAVVAVLCLLVIYAYGFNSVRFYEKSGMSIPVVGTNDDNANHIATAIISIKDQSLLISSKSLQKMIDDNAVNIATKWYPFGLYVNMNVGYTLLSSFLNAPAQLDVRRLFSFNTVFIVGLLLNLIILFYALADRIYKVRTIHAFALSLTLGLMVVLGEFFLKLQLYGFYSQLAGYCEFIALLLVLDMATKEKKLSFFSLVLICLFIIAIGTTYYLFIPLAGLAYFTFHANSSKDWRRMIPYIALVASCIPLIFFNSIYPIKTQGTAYGLAFVQFTGLMTTALGIMLSVLMRDRINQFLRRVLIFQFGLNICMMILGTLSMFTNTGNFGYYFFKSYWTMGILGLPLLVSFIGYFGDIFVTKSLPSRIIVTIAMIVLSGSAFYAVFSQPLDDSRGYDIILMIHNGRYNYPFDQKKWIKTYEKYGDKNGKNIYSVGIWGQSVLARALYGDTPDFMKIKHEQGVLLSEREQDRVTYKHILKRIAERKHTILLDNLYRIGVQNAINKNAKDRSHFENSKYLE